MFRRLDCPSFLLLGFALHDVFGEQEVLDILCHAAWLLRDDFVAVVLGQFLGFLRDFWHIDFDCHRLHWLLVAFKTDAVHIKILEMHEYLFLAARTHDQSVRFVDYGQFENRLIG